MLPFINQKEALPDYEIFVNLSNGKSIRLGAKPDASATQGLTWRLADPVCVNDVATVRLQDQDEFISDPLAEVHIQDGSVVDGNYRFDFETERSIALGIRSFFATPIGMAITAGFLIAVLVLLFSMYPF